MSSSFYLERRLRSGDKIFSEAALLAASRFIIVLAEPGAGKSRLLESLAQQQGTSVVSANRFVHQGARSNNSPLFIDAYDELSKMDSSGIYKLLGFAHEANPSGLVISSRSSEWDNTATYAFKDFSVNRRLSYVCWTSAKMNSKKFLNTTPKTKAFTHFKQRWRAST